jgi:hypothetical protein
MHSEKLEDQDSLPIPINPSIQPSTTIHDLPALPEAELSVKHYVITTPLNYLKLICNICQVF